MKIIIGFQYLYGHGVAINHTKAINSYKLGSWLLLQVVPAKTSLETGRFFLFYPPVGRSLFLN